MESVEIIFPLFSVRLVLLCSYVMEHVYRDYFTSDVVPIIAAVPVTMIATRMFQIKVLKCLLPFTPGQSKTDFKYRPFL